MLGGLNHYSTVKRFNNSLKQGKCITPASQVISNSPLVVFVGEPTGSLLVSSCEVVVSQEAAQDQTIVTLQVSFSF